MKGCKNCPAYAKCTVTYRGSACSALRSTYGIDTDPEIITNADRIRAMSDWELAVAAVRYKGTVVNATRYGGHEHKFYGPHGEPCANKEHAILMWFNWLQRQAEEDT